jgi:hypothetical protein
VQARISPAATYQAPGLKHGLTFAAVPDIVRRHSAGILIALLLAAVLVFPRWWVIASDPGDGVRVPVSPYGAGAIGYDEALYTSTVREAYDGVLPVRDQYLEDHGGDPPQRSRVPHEIIGLLGHVTGGPFSAIALTTSLFAAAALLLLYALLYQLTGSRWAAIALVPVTLLAIEVLNHAEGLLPLRHKDVYTPLLKIDPERELHAWTRFPAPILVLGPLFGLVLALPRAVETGARIWVVSAAIALAMLVYTYAYYWTAAGLAMFGWLGYLWLSGQRDESRRLLAVGVTAAMLALPEIIVLIWGAASLPSDARDRIGLDPLGIDMSVASPIIQRLVVGAPFVLALWLLRPSSRAVLYASLFLAPLVLAPIDGVIPQPWHYPTQVWGVFAIPVFAAGAAAMATSGGMRDMTRPIALALAVIAALGASYVIVLQARAVRQTDDAFAVTADEHAAFSWIRENVADNQTIVSPSITTNLLLASVSPAAQYIADGGFSTANDEELAERMLRSQAAFGLTEDEVFARLDINDEFQGFPVNDATGSARELERDLEYYLAFFTFSFEIEDRDGFVARIGPWRSRYRELLRTDDVLSTYAADYLYCGHRERFHRTQTPAPGTWVVEVFRQGDVAVFEIVGSGYPGAVEFAGCA